MKPSVTTSFLEANAADDISIAAHLHRCHTLSMNEGQPLDRESLHLDDRKLASVPDWIGSLRSLRELHLDGNLLTSFPSAIESLSALEVLHLRRNQLDSIPESISRLTLLRDLRIGKNLLTAIPDWLC